MCRPRNIAMHDYHESVTTKKVRLPDRQTPDKMIPMCRYAWQATQKSWISQLIWHISTATQLACLCADRWTHHKIVMPTGDAYSSGHLVPFLLDLYMFYLLRPILFRTCRYFSGLCSSNIPRYFLDCTYGNTLKMNI